MSREYPMNPTPAGPPSQKTLATPTGMGAATQMPGRGNKEIAPTTATMGPGTKAKTNKMPGLSVAPTPGKEYRSVCVGC